MRYLSAAIFGSGVASWNKQIFNSMLSSVGSELVTLSTISLIAGIAFLVWAELETVWKAKAGK